MPESMQPVFDNLKDDVIWTRARWTIYAQLYRKSELRVGLLNKTAGTFFNMVQHMFLDHTIMALSRLTDPVRIADKDNAVLAQIPAKLDADIHPEFH
jgi:hypothetical protein